MSAELKDPKPFPPRSPEMKAMLAQMDREDPGYCREGKDPLPKDADGNFTMASEVTQLTAVLVETLKTLTLIRDRVNGPMLCDAIDRDRPGPVAAKLYWATNVAMEVLNAATLLREDIDGRGFRWAGKKDPK